MEDCTIDPYYCNEFPYVKLFGITLLEPATVITDLIITAVCFYGLYKLRGPLYIHPVYRYFKMFLLMMGIATAIGGILGHGLFYLYGMNSKIPGWYVSMIAIAMFERASIMHARPLLRPSVGNFFALVNIIELITFMTITIIVVKFVFVEIHAVYGLFIVVFSFQLFVYFKKKDKGSLYIFAGTGMAALAALSHGMRIGINEWFNHNDVSHLGMATGMYFYYLGAKNWTLYDKK
jgi:hypothetical protein